MTGRVTEENNQRSGKKNLRAESGPLLEAWETDEPRKLEPVFLNPGGEYVPGKQEHERNAQSTETRGCHAREWIVAHWPFGQW